METKKKNRGVKTADKKKPDGRGGKRAGAGRKQGVSVGPYKGNDEILSAVVTFRVSESTRQKVAQLRAACKSEQVSLGHLFEKWVAGLIEERNL